MPKETELQPSYSNQEESRDILFKSIEIKLSSEQGAVEFSEEHIEKIKKVFSLFSKIDPGLIRAYSELKSINALDQKSYASFPSNGRIVESEDRYAILLTNRGMDTTISHRISSSENYQEEGYVDNFSGTLAHEITHGGAYAKVFSDVKFNKKFIMEWQEKFGWDKVTPFIKNEKTNAWEQSKKPIGGWNKNKDGKWQNGDYTIMGDDFTSMPEKCLGGKTGYAASVSMYEDICDSVAAYLLNPSVLNAEKHKFLEETINQYKESKKQKNT